MKILTEKKVHTDTYGGCVDIITGINDFTTPDLSYEEEWHTYRLNGKIIPSVTSLLDDGSYKEVNEDILKAAQQRGTLIHKEIETWIKTKKAGYTDELYAFINLLEENKDLFEKKAIFDIKTFKIATAKNKEKCYKQLCMYKDAIRYCTGEEIEGMYMIHLPSDKKAKIIDLRKEYEDGV